MAEIGVPRRAAAVALKGIRFAIAASDLRHGDRRAVEIYLLVTICGVSGPLAAEVCGCTKQNISKLLKAVEDRRDDPAFDRGVGRLEAVFGETA